MDRTKGNEVAELLTILVNETEKTNVCLERLEGRLGAVDAPTAELADTVRQVIGRMDRLEGLAKDVLTELRVVALYATQMTKRFERELAELRSRLDEAKPPNGGVKPPAT
jgi:23S rRNA G2069 N7-methylase RlmK/C1962 C5-methylase RlmI